MGAFESRTNRDAMILFDQILDREGQLGGSHSASGDDHRARRR
jgi:hypothetical protein